MKNNNFSKIEIIPINLNLDLPNDHLCMVMAQPFLKLQQTESGFKVDNCLLGAHKKIIQSTLKLAGDLKFGKSTYNTNNTNFILFPELSLPYDMISTIRDSMSQNSWPNNSILIGGLEGIGVNEYQKILEKSDNPAESVYELLGTATYVNCAAIFTKGKQHNDIRLYLQPKLRPSRWEQALGMREGKHLFIFVSPELNFFCLICFDAISSDLEFKSLTSSIMQELKKMAKNNDIPSVLDMTFILMHNNKPHYSGFQECANRILNAGGRELRCDHGSVVFINTANSVHGSSNKFGKSAFYFRRGAWFIPPIGEIPPETYCMEKTIEDKCQRARFREDGPSLHSFFYIPYTSELHTQEGQWYPFKNVAWYRVDSAGEISSSQSVPANRKIVSDNLLPNLPDNDNRWHVPNDSPLKDEIKKKYYIIRTNFIKLRKERISEITDLLLLCHYPKDKHIINSDHWKMDCEGEAIKELVSTFSILALMGETDFDLADSTLTGFLKDKFYVAVIDGKNTVEQRDLLKEYDEVRYSALNKQPEKNILVVLCRHLGEQPLNGKAKEIKRISKISGNEDDKMPPELRDSDKYTSITGRLFWHSRESLHGILEQNSLDDARRKLGEKLEPLTH